MTLTPKAKVRAAIAEIEQECGLPVGSLFLKNERNRPVYFTTPYRNARRKLYIKLAEALPHWSVVRIARSLGVDHSTIIHGFKVAGYQRQSYYTRFGRKRKDA